MAVCRYILPILLHVDGTHLLTWQRSWALLFFRSEDQQPRWALFTNLLDHCLLVKFYFNFLGLWGLDACPKTGYAWGCKVLWKTRKIPPWGDSTHRQLAFTAVKKQAGALLVGDWFLIAWWAGSRPSGLWHPCFQPVLLSKHNSSEAVAEAVMSLFTLSAKP